MAAAVRALEPMLRNATVKAIDGVARKVKARESATENTVTRLLTQWREMTPAEKEHVAEIALATATTAVSAIVALRRAMKSPAKTMAKKLVKVAKKK